MHCFLTGFDAFGNAIANVSQLAVEQASVDLPGLKVEKLILPTCCDLSFDALQKAVSQVPPGSMFALVMSGMANSRSKISVERFALNVRDYRIADNRGHQWGEETISKSAPDALRTNIDITALRAALEELGLLTETSYHAGSFVCNEIYFRALERWGAQPECAGVLFTHLPATGNYIAAKNESGEIRDEAAAINDYALALGEIAKYVCNF